MNHVEQSSFPDRCGVRRYCPYFLDFFFPVLWRWSRSGSPERQPPGLGRNVLTRNFHYVSFFWLAIVWWAVCGGVGLLTCREGQLQHANDVLHPASLDETNYKCPGSWRLRGGDYVSGGEREPELGGVCVTWSAGPRAGPWPAPALTGGHRPPVM